MMKTIKGKISKINHSEAPLNILSMSERNGVLTITLNGKQSVLVGDKVHFRRIVANEVYNTNVIMAHHIATVERVRRKGENTEIVMYAPPKISAFVDRLKTFDEVPDEDNIGPNGFVTKPYYKLLFQDSINLFPQDIVSGEISATLSCLGEEDIVLNEFELAESLSLTHRRDIGVSPKDMLMRKWLEVNNICDYEAKVIDLEQEFYYVPSRLVRNSIFLPDDTDAAVFDKAGWTVEFSQNEYYYAGEADEKGKRECVSWDVYNKDVFAKNLDYHQNDYVNEESNRNIVEINLETNYLQVGIGLTENTDYEHLLQEARVNELFYEKVKKSVIPDVIDMEKIKFQPAIKTEYGFIAASAVTYNIHLRPREGENWEYVEGGDSWNGIAKVSDITEENASKSDLLGYFGFTDDDIRFQKMKVKKSFIRMSYFDSNDFLDKQLINYSSVFLDGGELYGKYVKLRNYLIKKGVALDNGDDPQRLILLDEEDAPTRLDSNFTIRNEFYNEKSSEGFNIYYFSADAKDLENDEKTIYMQVEFNHAGYGKTIPLVSYGDGKDLTLSTYRTQLYIPIKLCYYNGKYYYYVDDSGNSIKNDRGSATITFNLFEPVLTKE